VGNSTPSNVPSDDQVRAQAEAALKEHDWEPLPGCWWDGELAVGRSADGKYEASLWASPDDEPLTPWRCDVGLTPPDSGKDSLWLLGIPRPEEVPALLERYADILSSGHEGRTLDLATGKVLVDGSGIVASIREARERLSGFEGATRALYSVGWEVQEVRLGVGGRPDTIITRPKTDE
jgi:hypothetical protein